MTIAAEMLAEPAAEAAAGSVQSRGPGEDAVFARPHLATTPVLVDLQGGAAWADTHE